MCWLGRKFPHSFSTTAVSSRRSKSGKVEEDIKKLSDVKEVIRESIVDKVLRYIDEYAKRKGKGTAGKTKSAIKSWKKPSHHVPLCRRLAVLHRQHFTDDDFRDEESTQEDRRAPDEDAQKDLRFQTCRFSISMSHARRSDGVEDTSALLMNEATALEKV